MQNNRYDPISTTVPHEEDDNNADTPTKSSAPYPTDDVLKDEDALLLYETRTASKPRKDRSAYFKVLRISIMVCIVAIISILLAFCVYMCITTECTSKNYKDLCEEGFCYRIDVDNYQDSNGDGVGDFIGVKQSLKFLREIGVQTVIIPLSSFKSTSPLHDDASFISMAKQGIKLGISTVLLLDDKPNAANADLLNKINSTISGYIASKDSPYFAPDNVWAEDLKCYTAIESPSQIGAPSNACNGTILELGGVYDLSSDAVLAIKNSNVTAGSVSIVSLKSIEPSVPFKNEKYLASLIFSSLINGAVGIKASDELGLNPKGKYSDALNNTNVFQGKVIALMKSIKNNRQNPPKMGRDCPVDRHPTDANDNVKMIVKKCVGEDIHEFFVAVYNNDDKDVSVALSPIVGNLDAAVSKKILLQSLPEDADPIEVANSIVLPLKSALLVYVKSKPTVHA